MAAACAIQGLPWCKDGRTIGLCDASSDEICRKWLWKWHFSWKCKMNMTDEGKRKSRERKIFFFCNIRRRCHWRDCSGAEREEIGRRRERAKGERRLHEVRKRATSLLNFSFGRVFILVFSHFLSFRQRPFLQFLAESRKLKEAAGCVCTVCVCVCVCCSVCVCTFFSFSFWIFFFFSPHFLPSSPPFCQGWARL